MTEQSQVGTEEAVPVPEQENPAVLLNADGEYVGANEKALDCHRYELDELLELSSCDVLVEDQVKAGAALGKVMRGEEVEIELHIQRGDGSSYIADALGHRVEVDGEPYCEVITRDITEYENNGAEQEVDESSFDHINADELEQIVQNIRVDAPSGEMPLNAIMLDLAVGHNELEQYKEGALSLHKAVDERLQEEEQHNPDSKECDVLREVKKAAFGLYLRLQRGDAELHGKRDGKYSGYFN
jgi:PAS domain S-box-containing protein